jgi:hypothetical protein
MAYKPKNAGQVRDKMYASEIAAQRPILATRMQCSDVEEESSVHDGESACEKFNRQLRSGIGTGRPTED